MPISKFNSGQNAPVTEQNGISNGNVHTPCVSRNGDKSNTTKSADMQQKLLKDNLERFAKEVLDDSGVASGSSILSASSNETLDTRIAETCTESVINGSSERYSVTPSPSSVKGSNRIVYNGATSSRRSPDLRVRFNERDFSDISSNIPASDISTKVGTDDFSTGGATVNPTLWLGDDQMLLLPGNSRSEETDYNSGICVTKSFDSLLSPNGTSILWDEDTDWILLFDNMIRYADKKQHRTTRSCGCKGEPCFFPLIV